MVLAALVVSMPVSYILVKKWLDGFVCKVDPQWWIFAGVGMLVIIITWLTVGVQTLKAAMVNPTECLNDE